MSPASNLFEHLGARILAQMFEVAAHGLALLDEEQRMLHVNQEGCRILGRSYDLLLGQELPASLDDQEQGEAAAWLRESLSGEPLKRDFTLQSEETRESGAVRKKVASFFCVPVRLDQRDAALVAFHDVTSSRRVEQEAQILTGITASLSREQTVGGTATRLAAEVVSSTAGIASAVVLLAGEPLVGRVAGSSGLPDPFVHALEASLLADPASLAERVPEPGDVRVIPRLKNLYRSDPLREHFGPQVDQLGWDTLVCVPLAYQGSKRGALFVYLPEGLVPGDEDIRLVRAIADQGVFALETARLLVDAQEKAALEERQRLARELHDSVSQALYGIALGTRSARSQLEKNPERVAERLDYVMNMAEAAIGEMRALIFELRPETLEQEGLVMALAKQASALHARHGLEVNANLGPEPRLAFTEKQALYRVVQEAFHNIVKHARASRVDLELTHDPAGNLLLAVSDDGAGFDASGPARPGHFGLSTMRERAESVGGTFRLSSAPGEGTSIHVSLPIAQRDAYRLDEHQPDH